MTHAFAAESMQRPPYLPSLEQEPGLRLHTASVRAAGFTLIEILVITVIMGIIVVLAAANFFPDDRQVARREVERIALALQAARDAAVFGGTATAVSVENNRVLRWLRDDRGAWQPDSAAENHAVALAPEVAITALSIGAAPADANSRMAFLPDGVGIPFEMRLAYRGVTSRISGDPLGKLRIEFEAP
jgi:general secretion pathway protein H